ncbi:plasmid partitioning protein RepB C-terminal domain-containing protein, partial [Anaerobaca lacustris]|nr:plasmid partitioning protein RepB C-terminal domain-containing protein [Sedimentisphaerales bacterium M17dextr]
ESSTQTAPNGTEDQDVARLQREIRSMEHEFKLVQEEYGKNMLNLVVVIGYLRSLLDNAAVVRYLSQAEPTMLAEFQKIMDQAEMKATG